MYDNKLAKDLLYYKMNVNNTLTNTNLVHCCQLIP